MAVHQIHFVQVNALPLNSTSITLMVPLLLTVIFKMITWHVGHVQ
jgi:hypothetical protein